MCENLKTLGLRQQTVLWTSTSMLTESFLRGNFHILALRYVRRSLIRDATNAVACCIVHSRLDYFNSMLHAASEKLLDRLQASKYKLGTKMVAQVQ